METQHKAHGMQGTLVAPDWPLLTLPEVDLLLRTYPQARGAERILSFSPRPFSAGSIVLTRSGSLQVFVKRHHRLVRDREGLLEEHRFLQHLAPRCPLVQSPLVNENGETAIESGDWTYEVHPLAHGQDLYEQAQSWTPFFSTGHAHAAGRALAQLHGAAAGYIAQPREARQLVTSFTIFAAADPAAAMASFLESRPALKQYAETREWRQSLDDLQLPLFNNLKPWLPSLPPLWTHNDFHPSNLTWHHSVVSGIIDFGLADRTNAVHDLATAIERSTIEWLYLADPTGPPVHLDQIDALLAGYEELSPLSYDQARALAAMLPLVHCEFALSETDYFLSILHSEDKAFLAYEGYFLAHTAWFQSPAGRSLIEHLNQWAASHAQAESEAQ